MANAGATVYEKRRYAVQGVAEAKSIASMFLADMGADGVVGSLGLPEVDDRYHFWRVPLIGHRAQRLGEIVIDARTSLVQRDKSTNPEVIWERNRSAEAGERRSPANMATIARSQLRNTIIQGDAEETLQELPAGSVDLVFTSPPYFNARPDYTEYAAYEDYLAKMGRVIGQCHRLLAEGRFFVINVAPALLRRTSRSQSSRRIAIPFDMHGVITRQGFDFVDDIIWEKPEGAGWATGRGRRFAADRTPLQYKTVPVTEYVLVYRKQSDRLIDWNIRNHPDPEVVERSKVENGYERTNIWRIKPASTKDHPAVFPLELASRVVRYYSFEGDVALDPFAGSGTVGQACVELNRRFVLSELEPEYVSVIKRKAVRWLGCEAEHINCIGTPPISAGALL